MRNNSSHSLSYLDIASRVILENSTDFIVIFDSNGEILFFNKVAKIILDFGSSKNSNFFDIIERLDNVNIRKILLENDCVKSIRFDINNFKNEVVECSGNISLLHSLESVKHFIFSSTTYNSSRTQLLNKRIFESEEKYIKLVNQSTDCVLLHENGIITFVNNAGIKILGAKSASEIVGRTNISFVHPDYRAEISKRIKEIQTTGNFLPWLEQKFVKVDDTPIDVEAASSAIELNGEKVIQLIVKDLTEKRKNEKRIISSQKQISAFIDALPDDVYILNEDGIYVDVISSLKSNTKIGESIFNIFNEDTAQKILETIRKTIDSKQSQTLEYEFKNHFSEGRTALLDYYEGKNRVLWIARDITDRKNVETIIKQNEETLTSFIEQSSDGISIVDHEGKIIVWNQARANISGYQKDEIIGKYIWDVQWMIQKNKENAQYTLEQLKENTLNLLNRKSNSFPASQVRRVEILTKNNETKSIETFIFPMDTATGKKIGSICRDVTKVKQTEETLLNAKHLAEKANEAKSLFIAKISHEIRTPLNGIIGFTNILFENENDSEKKEMLSLINTSSETLLRLISDILDFSKIESGKINLQETDFYLNEVISSTVKSFQTLADKKQLQLKYSQCENARNLVVGDKIAIKQILINLLSNAIKYTSFGKIDVDLKCEINKEITTAIISVTDTGKGMTSEFVENLSGDILSMSFSDSDKSSGLGLSIVKSLLKMMNGTISVESEIGVGSKFTVKFSLKLSKNENQKIESKPEPQIEKNETIKILVAEDDLTNQHLIKAFAKNKPWELVIVDNGEKAVKEFESNNYNIILMDVQMPILNGIDATKQIREIEIRNLKKHIPIIALTAYAMESDKQKCFDAGMDAFLSKPININKLFSTIGKFVN